MNELSLYSGAGGGLLGTLLLGFTPIGYVEIDSYCQQVIAQRITDGILPVAPIFGDVRKFIQSGAAREYRGFVDVVTGGFPCQGFSVAGKRLGAADPRNMWPATLEVIRQVRPRYCFLENVRGLLSSGYFQEILKDLAESGYDVRWRVLSARELGAPHKRERLWILAYTSGTGARLDDRWTGRSSGQRGKSTDSPQSEMVRQEHKESGAEGTGTSSRNVPNTNGQRQQEHRFNITNESQQPSVKRDSEDVSNTSSKRLEGKQWSQSQGSGTRLTNSSWWETEPELGRLAHGISNRVDRLRAIGNGQVPVVAAKAWQLLVGEIRHMSLARQLYSIFFDGCIAYALGGVTAKGDATYISTEGIPALAQIEQHIVEEIVLGAYTVLPGNIVRWIAFDVDSKKDPEKAIELTSKISSYLGTIPHAVEWSGNKGYHIYLFFPGTVSAKEARRIGLAIHDNLALSKNGDPHVEVFPKQDELTESNPLGNLLRLPLGVHPATKNKTKFVDPHNDWQEIDAEMALSQRANLEDLQALVKECEPIQRIVNLLAPYWNPGQRHHLALCTSGFLAISGWTVEAVKDLITALHEEIGDGDLDNQLETVTDTFEKYVNDKTILGYQGLSEVLPNSVLKQLTEIAHKQVFPAILQNIDRIRLEKGATFLKVRDAAKTIIGYFRENGKLVRDSLNTYWLDGESKNLLMVGGVDWDRFMHNEFGLNSLESFGKQTVESVKHYAREDSKEVSVYKRSWWSGRELFINLGGPEVLVLNGNPKQRRVAYNGENDILFLNSEERMCLPNLEELDIEPMDPWAFLVDDLNFATGGNINATPTQQRELLKAFIVSIFFAQTLPTRPILTLLAAAGAGKTTTARRILRFLEGPQEDVLGVVSDKPDSLRSSLEAHKVLVLDNLEKSKTSWLTDILNRVSTGSHIELRVLHTTNKVRVIKPDLFVIITATEMPFSEETVFTRILPIELAPLTSPRPEYQIQLQLLENFNALWKGLLDDLDRVVAELRSNTTVEAPNESRLADFTVFCSRIQGCSFLDGKELMAGLSNLVARQKNVLSENSPFIDTLEIYLRTRGEDTGRWMNMSEFFAILNKIANANRIEWRWGSPQGLSRHVGMLEPNLIRFYGMSTKKVRESGREITLYRFDKKMLTM